MNITRHTDANFRRALSPTVIRLGLVSFFADVASEMLYPITPLFLTALLGASISSVGLIEGIAEGTASLLKVYAGTWSDRSGNRKFFVGAGYLFAAIAKPLIGLASSWPLVLFARSFDRFGKGIRSAPRDAMLSESIAPELRGAAFGWHRMMDTLGATVGPLGAVLFLHFYQDPEDLRYIYFLALIPGLLSVALVLSVRDSARTKSPATPRPVTVQRPMFSLSNFSRDFKIYLGAWFIFSLANSSDVFLILKAQKSGFNLTETIFLYTFYNLIYSVGSPYLGAISDKIGRKPVLIMGLLVFAAVYAWLGLATQHWQFWLIFGVYGLYMAATDGVGKAFAVDLVRPESKASGLGFLGTLTGIATLFASVIAGFLWDHLGNEFTFFYGSAGALIAAGVLLSAKPQALLNSPLPR